MEVSQTLYEIAMSIGNHLDFNEMCDEVASVTMQKLNCTAFAIFCEKRVPNNKFVFENVYLAPESGNVDQNYESLLASIPQDIIRKKKTDYYTQLPLQFKQKDKGVWHLMLLPGYGLLALFRENDPLPSDMISSLEMISKKLAITCYACREHIQLDTSIKRQKLILEAMSEGVVVINNQRIIQYVNEGVCKLLSKERGELMGQTVEDSLDHYNKGIFQSVIQAFSCKGFTQCEIVWTKKDGRQLETLTSVTPSTDKDNKLTEYTLVLTDLTLQKKAEEQSTLEMKMETVGTLAGGIAHDFNNMLAIITGNISFALTKIDCDHELFSFLSDAEKGANQAARLTDQLLTFAKGGSPVTETIDINLVIRESVEFVLRGSNVTCEFDLQNDIPPVEVDTGQINQVMHNLVINANQAMPKGGSLFISSRTETMKDQNHLSLPLGNYIKIIIRDEGIGIPKKHLKRIFDPFFSTKQNGNGIGLATTFSIIKKHSGMITVDSKTGQGTSFCIYLPESIKVIPTNSSGMNNPHSGKGRILVMDDNEMMLNILGTMLKNIGYEVSLTPDGHDALSAYEKAEAEKETFDLVILDLTVPGGMGGAEVMTELLKINPDVKALVASGYSNDPIMANYAKNGFCGVIPKPFNMDGLKKVLNSVL